MPIFLAAFLGGLIQSAASIAGRVLIALGVGIVSYTGISSLLDVLKAQVQSYLLGVSADIVGVMSALRIDVSISILFSAYAARLVLMGLTSDTVKRMVLK